MRVKVWDAFVRWSHWGLAALVLAAFLTSEEERAPASLHVRVGLAVLALVVARTAYGFVGPEPARFAAFVRRPREVLAHAREMLAGKPRRHLSHNPVGGLMVVALLALLLGLVATGLLAHAGPGAGERLSDGAAHAAKELHEGLSTVLLVLVGVHLAGVLASSLLERQNLVAGMITGWKRAPEEGSEAASAPLAGGFTRRALAALGSLAIGLGAAGGADALLGATSRGGAAGVEAAPGAAQGEASGERDGVAGERELHQRRGHGHGRREHERGEHHR